MCKKRCNGALSTGGSSPRLKVTEANINEGEVEGCAAVHHLVEEFHCQCGQLNHSIIGAAYRDITETIKKQLKRVNILNFGIKLCKVLI